MRASLSAAARISSCSFVLAFGLAGCGGGDDEQTQVAPGPGSREAVDAAIQRATSSAPGEVRFTADVLPVFFDKCAYCHHPSNATGVDLTRPFDAVRGIVGRETSRPRAEARLLVDPGNPANSFVLDKVLRENLVQELEGEAMPWQIPALDAAAIASIRRWISEGASDDATYRAEVAPSFAQSCVFCHDSSGIQEPDLTQPFDPVVGIVGVSAGSRARVEPGNPDESLLVLAIEGKPAGGVPMPFHPERLTEAEVSALIRWIAAGAPDN